MKHLHQLLLFLFFFNSPFVQCMQACKELAQEIPKQIPQAGFIIRTEQNFNNEQAFKAGHNIQLQKIPAQQLNPVMIRTMQLQLLANMRSFTQEGFLGTTIVKTQNGYCHIDQIKVGDLVACKDPASEQQIYKPVTFVGTAHVARHIQIHIKGEVVHVAPDHKFYSATVNKWYTAQKLYEHPELRTLVDERIDDVVCVNQGLDVVQITVDEVHNFFITKHDILVHNFVEITAVWGIGQGMLATWEVVVPAIIAGVGYWVAKSRYKNDYKMGQADQNKSVGGSFVPDPDPKDKSKTRSGQHGKYEDAPYHHKNSRGRKSPAPKDGQAALDNSVIYNENSQHRIGISKDQFVVLKKTRQNLYHGYVNLWEELEFEMQQALIKAKKVTRSGKIIR